ncbi:MAG: tetratricopeptide repeat protein [Planctomycetes bacterium]|nr:tetratricopeptide repeat protein [Planctomycetota bacterium]
MNALRCPLVPCSRENDPTATNCSKCGTPLRQHARLSSHAARLFNRGLEAARAGQAVEAAEQFAAVVLWHPRDLDARVALGWCHLSAGHPDDARRQFEIALQQSPGLALAVRGLASAVAPRRSARSADRTDAAGAGRRKPRGKAKKRMARERRRGRRR